MFISEKLLSGKDPNNNIFKRFESLEQSMREHVSLENNTIKNDLEKMIQI